MHQADHVFKVLLVEQDGALVSPYVLDKYKKTYRTSDGKIVPVRYAFVFSTFESALREHTFMCQNIDTDHIGTNYVVVVGTSTRNIWAVNGLNLHGVYDTLTSQEVDAEIDACIAWTGCLNFSGYVGPWPISKIAENTVKLSETFTMISEVQMPKLTEVEDFYV